MRMPDFVREGVLIDEARTRAQSEFGVPVAVFQTGDGRVRFQIPEGDREWDDRKQIYLTDAEPAAGVVPVPDLSKLDPPTVAQAYLEFGRQNLDLLITDGRSQPRRPRGDDGNRIVARVADDTPTKVPLGSAVTVVLYGDHRLANTVPTLVGKTADEAVRLIDKRRARARIKTGRAVHRKDDDFKVVGQIPVPGTPITNSTRHYSLTEDVPAETSVPDDLVGMTVTDAVDRCADEGLELSICNSGQEAAELCDAPDDYGDVPVSGYHWTTAPGAPINEGGTVGIIAIRPIEDPPDKKPVPTDPTPSDVTKEIPAASTPTRFFEHPQCCLWLGLFLGLLFGILLGVVIAKP